MGRAAAQLPMDSSTPALADWLAIHDGGLPIDAASKLDAANLGRVLSKLEGRLHRTALVVEAMAQLLEAQGLLSEQQLLARAEAIDLSDGVADGRQVRQVSLSCGQCGRVNLGNRQRCLYCGSEDLRPLASSS